VKWRDERVEKREEVEEVGGGGVERKEGGRKGT